MVEVKGAALSTIPKTLHIEGGAWPLSHPSCPGKKRMLPIVWLEMGVETLVANKIANKSPRAEDMFTIILSWLLAVNSGCN